MNNSVRNRVTADTDNREKIRTAKFSLGTALFLSLSKFLIAFITGSLGVLSSAIDNIGDIIMSTINLVSIRKSAEPPDKSHPYGHGKVESVAAAIQGLIIAGIGGWIILESIKRYYTGSGLARPGAGIAVMVISVIVSFIAARKVEEVGKRTGSAALVADALHFKTDVYSGCGILAALILVSITKNPVFDSIAGLTVGIFIIKATFPLLKGVADDLLDRELPEETVARIIDIINRHRPMVVDFHAMRTRRAGSMKHIDFHLVVCREANVSEAHRLAEHIEMEIEEDLGRAHVVTHIDPCGEECPSAGECDFLREKMINLRSPGKDRDREKYFFDD